PLPIQVSASLRPAVARRLHRGRRALGLVGSILVALASGCAPADSAEPGGESPGRPGAPDEGVGGGNEPTLSPEAPETADSDPDAGIDFGDVPIQVPKTTSSRVELSWEPIEGAQEIRLFIGPEPKGNGDGMPLEVEVAQLDG